MIEMLIGASVLSISLLAISYFFQITLRASTITKTAVQGDYLLEEGVEVTKIFRDMSYKNNFQKMSTTTTYYFSWSGTNWATSTTNVYIDGVFEREFTLADVTRDLNGNIASSGTYDPNVKLVTVSVSWAGPTGTTTHSIQTYVTNIFNN